MWRATHQTDVVPARWVGVVFLVTPRVILSAPADCGIVRRMQWLRMRFANLRAYGGADTKRNLMIAAVLTAANAGVVLLGLTLLSHASPRWATVPPTHSGSDSGELVGFAVLALIAFAAYAAAWQFMLIAVVIDGVAVLYFADFLAKYIPNNLGHGGGPFPADHGMARTGDLLLAFGFGIPFGLIGLAVAALALGAVVVGVGGVLFSLMPGGARVDAQMRQDGWRPPGER